MVLKDPVSALASGNRALREQRWEDAVRLYGAAHREVPELSNHIDFNLNYLSRSFQGEEKTPILVAAVDSPPSHRRLPKRDVLVLVLARHLQQAGNTAQLLARRADYPIGVVVLLAGTSQQDVTSCLSSVLRATTAKYALIVNDSTLPGRDWVRQGYTSLSAHGADVVYANTATNAEMPPWMNVLAPPNQLADVVEGGRFAKLKAAMEPSFLLADLSCPNETDIAPQESQPGLHVLNTDELDARSSDIMFSREICVVMPCLDEARGRRTAQLLLKRAGMDADIVVVVDRQRQGFIPTLNRTVRHSGARYIVYLAEDAWPGDDWLVKAHQRLEDEEKNLLAFNCGKWHGRVAAFGMVDREWAYGLYGDQILYGGYTAHRADNELTAIARAQDSFIYAPECVLAEYDVRKDFRRSERQAANFQRSDARLFRERFQQAFQGLADSTALAEFEDEYLNLPKFYASRAPLTIS